MTQQCSVSCMVQPQLNGEPEKADLSRQVKFMSDDGTKIGGPRGTLSWP